MARVAGPEIRGFDVQASGGDDADAAARSLFSVYQMRSPRWRSLAWEDLREETKRLLRREAMWSAAGHPQRPSFHR
ncbi:hypothetical protein [Azospirillum sp. SYSU D00513]|uniref:hypothetical protein n=1 Tax=Azospirillum sp. SYSU D00513 TaxID=2812561 RepID=UPI001A967EE9|nr:hypothetical protein [Azospirillum sp. SYSU D00513]